MRRIRLAAAVLLALGLIVWGASFLSAAAGPQAASSTPPAFNWAKTWGGSGTSTANVGHVAGDAQGNVYVVGDFKGAVDFNPDPAATDVHTSVNNSIDAFVAKFDASGKFQWAKTWGGAARDVAYGNGLDSQGNVYVVGPFRETVDFNPDPAVTAIYTSNAGSENNVYLTKFTPAGVFVWTRTWGPGVYAGGAEGYNVAIDGNYLYVAGDFSGNQTDFNPWGGHDWRQNHLPVTGAVYFDAFLSKFDLNGNFQWARTWGGEGYDDGPGVAVDPSGNIYVAGMYASQNINFNPNPNGTPANLPAHDSGALVDVFLTKFDASGNFLWARTWGSTGYEEASGNVSVDASGNAYVGGRFAGLNVNFNPNPNGTPAIYSTHNPMPYGDWVSQERTGMDAFVSKFAADGTFQWVRVFGGNGSDNGNADVDSAGNVYVSGTYSDTVDFDPSGGVTSFTSNGKHDLFLSQFDASGNFNWVKTWGGSGEEFGNGGLGPLGQVYMAGSFAGSVDFDPGAGTDNHTATGASDAFLSQFAVTQMQIAPATVNWMTLAGSPARTFTLTVSNSVLTFTWTAAFTPTTPAWASVQPVSGQSGQALMVILTPTLSAGTYQTGLRLVSSNPQVQNNDQTIPIQLKVVNQVYTLFLPFSRK